MPGLLGFKSSGRAEPEIFANMNWQEGAVAIGTNHEKSEQNQTPITRITKNGPRSQALFRVILSGLGAVWWSIAGFVQSGPDPG
jgi:hypothetical protein